MPSVQLARMVHEAVLLVSGRPAVRSRSPAPSSAEVRTSPPPSTIRGIHSILSGAFAAAQRWEWTDREPAESAKLPTTIRQPIPATSPDDVAGGNLDIKGGRHYTASQFLADGFDLRNTAARLGHSGGGATTLRHYADPVSEVDRCAAAYLAKADRRIGGQEQLNPMG
jgi:hypothetical protein